MIPGLRPGAQLPNQASRGGPAGAGRVRRLRRRELPARRHEAAVDVRTRLAARRPQDELGADTPRVPEPVGRHGYADEEVPQGTHGGRDEAAGARHRGDRETYAHLYSGLSGVSTLKTHAHLYSGLSGVSTLKTHAHLYSGLSGVSTLKTHTRIYVAD